MQKKSKNQVVNLCLASIMAALYVGLDFLATTLSTALGGSMKISFSGLAVIIVAVFAGPIWGAACGFVGAFIGQMITYGFSATTLLWVSPAVIRGLVMGILFIAFKKSLKPHILIVETVISSLLVTAANTAVMYIDSKIYHYYSYTYVFGGIMPRIISGVLTAVVFAFVLPPIIKTLYKKFA